MTNIWKKKSLSNPYYETAFHILGITRDVVSAIEIVQKIEERRQAVKNMPDFYKLGSRPLAETDISRAGQIMSDPTRRILEELLFHKSEKLQVEDIKKFKKKIEHLDLPEKLPKPHNFKFIHKLIQELLKEHIENLPAVEIHPIPIEIDIIPPIGPIKEKTDD